MGFGFRNREEEFHDLLASYDNSQGQLLEMDFSFAVNLVAA